MVIIKDIVYSMSYMYTYMYIYIYSNIYLVYGIWNMVFGWPNSLNKRLGRDNTGSAL